MDMKKQRDSSRTKLSVSTERVRELQAMTPEHLLHIAAGAVGPPSCAHSLILGGPCVHSLAE
jgi:hypothetical protein